MMSADNAIGVLATQRRDGKPGLEYRVVHAQAIENAWCEPDYPRHHPELNRECALGIWGKSEVFMTADDAMRAATEMKTKCEVYGVVEYGIVYYNHPKVFFPASDGKRRQRKRYDQYRIRQHQTV